MPATVSMRSRLQKVLAATAVVIAALLGADRLAELVTAYKLSSRIESSQGLSTRPHVTIGGWPFLTQVLHGRYRDVTVSSSDPIGKSGVEVNDAVVQLHGVRVNASAALHGTVPDVPVDSSSGTALLTYPELDHIIARYLPGIGSQITVIGTTPGHARVKGPLGLALNVTAQFASNKLTVVPDEAQLSALPEVLRTPIDNALGQPITLPPFPFHVRLVSASLQPDGVHLRAAARDSVFPVR